jgi:cysteine protease ATG4
MQSTSEIPDSNKDRSQSDASLDMVSEAPSADKLPLPQNFNNLGNAPLADRILSNSSYLAAEIPHKIGSWAKNIWETSTDLSNSVLNRQGASLPGSWTGDSNGPDNEAADLRSQGLWLLGCRYELPDNESLESKIIAAQAESMFDQQAAHSLTAVPVIDAAAGQEPTSATAHSDTPSTVSDGPPTEKPANDSAEENTVNKFAVSSLWPADFYEDFTSRLWYTYRHNYPPIRPASYKTDIGWGCMLRSGQSLLANTLVIHLLGRGMHNSLV